MDPSSNSHSAPSNLFHLFISISLREKRKRDFERERERVFLTFHDVHDGADIPFLDDEAPLGVIHWVHAVHYLPDLGQLQVLHKVVPQDGALDQLPRSVFQKREKRVTYKLLGS